jgi:hypothetical protein
MAHNETTLLNSVREDFLAQHPGGYWRKLHGGPYQSAGLPDVVCATANACATVEFKWATPAQLRQPLVELCKKLLTPKQALENRVIANLDGPLVSRIVIGCEIEDRRLPGRKAVYAAGFNYVAVREMSLSEAALPQGLCETLNGMAVRCAQEYTWRAFTLRGIFRQLRLRGERWGVDSLLFDDGRWINQTTKIDPA